MKLKHWKEEIKDLKDYPSSIIDEGESMLANSVTAANFDLIRRLKANENILEIGCGIASYIKDNVSDTSWEGIDVYKKNNKGVPTIATKIASVEHMPYINESFDYVISNQSIEHWHEYHVSINIALDEIIRVLKVGGKALINFPIHLHGQKEFVMGDFLFINNIFDIPGTKISRKTAYIDSREENYKGWKRCGFPESYIMRSPVSEDTSYVLEYELEKVSNEFDKEYFPTIFSIKSRKSSLTRAIHYGFLVFLYKVIFGVKRRL